MNELKRSAVSINRAERFFAVSAAKFWKRDISISGGLDRFFWLLNSLQKMYFSTQEFTRFPHQWIGRQNKKTSNQMHPRMIKKKILYEEHAL